ncbi:MAG TPA: hypothetical protein VGM49_06655 [Candidatus Limnocylindrales bacterium]|jgi:hypothetical protein
MADTPSPPSTATDFGVVNPLRPPGSARVRRAWDALPTIARAFVLLAIVDVVVRGLGLFGMGLFLDPGYPLGVFTTFLPHDGLIVLPAIVLARQPDLRARAILLWVGILVVALIELLRGPLIGIASGSVVDPFGPLSAVGIATSLGAASGWILIARGLRFPAPGRAELWLAGLGNLVALVIVASAVLLNVGAFFALEEPGAGTSQLPLLQLNATAMILAAMGTAYLGRALLRGSRDRVRPPKARAMATASALLFGTNALFLVFGGVVFFGSVPLPTGGRFDAATTDAILWLTDSFAWTLLLVAFGLGLADVSGRAPKLLLDVDNGRSPESGPAWPAPGGEVPSFNPTGAWTAEALARKRTRHASTRPGSITRRIGTTRSDNPSQGGSPSGDEAGDSKR